MATQFKHTCVKPACNETYQDTDPDAYYCSKCSDENKKIAEKVNATINSRPRKQIKSALQEYDEAQKIHGFVQTTL